MDFNILITSIFSDLDSLILRKRILIHIFQGLVKTDPCLYLVKYSPDVLKKIIKVLEIFNTNKKCFVLITIESSPWEI